MSNRNKHITEKIDKNRRKRATQNVSKEKIFNGLIAILTVIIAVISLLVAFLAMYTNNRLAINNSALNFSYDNFEIRTKTSIALFN